MVAYDMSSSASTPRLSIILYHSLLSSSVLRPSAKGSSAACMQQRFGQSVLITDSQEYLMVCYTSLEGLLSNSLLVQ